MAKGINATLNYNEVAQICTAGEKGATVVVGNVHLALLWLGGADMECDSSGVVTNGFAMSTNTAEPKFELAPCEALYGVLAHNRAGSDAVSFLVTNGSVI